MGNVHKVRSSDTLEICRSKMDPTFFSGRSDLPVGSQIIIKYDSVFYLSALVHMLHHQAPGAIQHSGSCELKKVSFICDANFSDKFICMTNTELQT